MNIIPMIIELLARMYISYYYAPLYNCTPTYIFPMGSRVLYVVSRINYSIR